ncbi:MAG: ATP phosphoribosyltransferase regulatory subunit [Candidatus Eremiobacteraeota bacterium]|uniref:Histidyl-tRNA synthetase, class IIa n=1 Tax=mine drainage metagenome TaxID=410659 RepID=E6PDQ5_9ZZZZ|nr:ATP phosphoribosyltransferase regulatory subunit [Candidatus Eremiobacteraeota bacterium]
MRLPSGVRDWLPQEFAFKQSVEDRIAVVFDRWSYARILTPTFESYESLERGLGEKLMRQTFRFSDPLGEELALRTEMTTPIARVVSTRLRNASLPIRLSYIAPAYRYEEPQLGRMREFTQAGAELIGAAGADADAEALFMAIETLDAVGLSDAQFDINDSAIVDGALVTLGLSAVAARSWKEAIAARNLVDLDSFASRDAVHPERYALLRRLIVTRGTAEVLAMARELAPNPEAQAAIYRLERILARGSNLGFGARLAIDPALLRDLEYYTGFVFEGFLGDLGFSLCGGGRYDALLPRFGYDVPAVGWMVGVERILLALERRRIGERRRREVDVFVVGSDRAAMAERASGRRVRVDVRGLDRDAAMAYARHKAIPRVLIARGDALEEILLEADEQAPL